MVWRGVGSGRPGWPSRQPGTPEHDVPSDGRPADAIREPDTLAGPEPDGHFAVLAQDAVLAEDSDTGKSDTGKSDTAKSDTAKSDTGKAGKGDEHAEIPPWLRIATMWTWRLLLLAGAVYVLALAASKLYIVVVPCAAAILLTALLQPLANRLRRR